jgi:hypothetical protein
MSAGLSPAEARRETAQARKQELAARRQSSRERRDARIQAIHEKSEARKQAIRDKPQARKEKAEADALAREEKSRARRERLEAAREEAEARRDSLRSQRQVDGPLVRDLDKRGESLVAGNLQTDERILVKLQGNFGQAFVVSDRRVYCLKWGFMTDQAFGGRCSAFEHRAISGVQIKKHMTTALLEVITPGNQDNKRLAYWGGRNSPNNAVTADNAVTFGTADFALFQRAVNVAREQISASQTPSVTAAPAAAPDVLDQLGKLGGLRDQGILTEEEFQQKKVDLLERL